MPRFMLFYADGPAAAPPELPPARLNELIGEYVAWGDNLPPGTRIDGARLSSIWSDPGRVLSGHGEGLIVTDGPFAETHEVIGGYAIVEAKGYDEAAALCRNHPHLRHGRIIIRQQA